MSQRLRKAYDDERCPFAGPIEIDDTYIVWEESKKHANMKLNAEHGAVGNVVVVEAKDRKTGNFNAKPVRTIDTTTLHRFVHTTSFDAATVYTHDFKAYHRVDRNHKSVKHNFSHLVNGQVPTNGIEWFGAGCRRGYRCIFHQVSENHRHRYVYEFAGRHNNRNSDTIIQMGNKARSMKSRRLTGRELTT